MVVVTVRRVHRRSTHDRIHPNSDPQYPYVLEQQLSVDNLHKRVSGKLDDI